MDPATFARLERRLRPILVRLPAAWVTKLTSVGRIRFLASLVASCPRPVEGCFSGSREQLAVTLWHGLSFRSPLMNAAGMFKNGEGYELAAVQGAGGYLAGTTTATPRAGNRAHGVVHPFVPYPRSGAASNWLGLPNPGHAVVAARLARRTRVQGCPIGASVAAVVDTEAGAAAEEAARDGLIAGMQAYERAGVDFLELNESCPNTEDEAVEGEAGWQQLEHRLTHVRDAFLAYRTRPLPVVVKLSSDTPVDQIPRVVALLRDLGFDGINLGNTSIRYAHYRAAIDAKEQDLFDHFTGAFGGGLSGRPLHDPVLDLVRAARAAAPTGGDAPFVVIATGGIETAGDVAAAQAAGADLCQWYTGYFEAFSRHGHQVYDRIYRALG
jgi:dihydroorotate dehydrogenase